MYTRSITSSFFSYCHTNMVRLFTCIDSHVFVWSIPSRVWTRCGARASAAWRQVAPERRRVRLLLVHSSRCKFVTSCNRAAGCSGVCEINAGVKTGVFITHT